MQNTLNFNMLMKRNSEESNDSFIGRLGEILYRIIKRIGELLVAIVKRVIKELWKG